MLDPTAAATTTAEIAAPQPPVDSATNGSGSRGGSTRAGVVPGPAPAGVPSIAWHRPDIQSSGDEITTDGDAVYVSYSDRDATAFAMTAFDLTTGKERWSIDIENGSWFVPIANDEFVFFPRNSPSTFSGELLALDRADGSVIWSYGADYGFTGVSPALAGGLVYIATQDLSLRAVDAKTGEEVWRANLFDVSPGQTEGIGDVSVAAADGVVYAAGAGGLLFAFDADDGGRLWSAQIDGSINRSPVVSDGIVFVSSLVFEEGAAGTPGRLSALDARTGEPVWETKVLGSSFSLTAADDTLFVIGSTPGGVPLEALDARTGEPRWTNEDADVMFAPIVAGGTLFVAGKDGAIVGLDTATGTRNWSVYLGWTPDPIVVDGLLIASAGAQGLIAVQGDGGANPAEVVDLSGLPACKPPRDYPRAEIDGTPAATIEQETRLEEREGRPPTWEDGRAASRTEFPQILTGNVPLGEPASAGAISEIQATLRGMKGCSVRPEGGRMLQGYFTDDFFRRDIATWGPDGYTMTWAVQPEEDEIDEMTTLLLENGRVAVIVPFGGQPSLLLIFVEQDDVWLIDEVYSVVGEYNFGPLG